MAAPPENNELQGVNDAETPTSGDDTEQGSGILAVYFSRPGNAVREDGVDAVTSASINVM